MADGADCGAQERRSQRLITAHLHSFSLIQLLPLFFFLNVKCVNYRFLLVLSEIPVITCLGASCLEFLSRAHRRTWRRTNNANIRMCYYSRVRQTLRAAAGKDGGPHSGTLMCRMEFLEGHI